MAIGTLAGGTGFSPFSGGQSIQSFKTGALAGSVAAVRCNPLPCSYVNFLAPKSNTGEVYIGPDTSVTVEAGTTNYTAGWELQAGQQTGWLPVSDMSMFAYICDAAADDLLFFVI